MKNPNGYGSVYKLSGNRRKPFVAIVTDKWILDGKKAIQKRKPIGYYPTQAEAKKALANYNENPYNLDNNKLTFADVYDLWSNRKFQEISESNIKSYKASFKTCEKIHNLQFTSIKLSHLQSVVDESNKNYPTLKKLKTLFAQVFDFAVENEIIGRDKHIVEYVKIGEPVISTLHYRFTEDEIKIM